MKKLNNQNGRSMIEMLGVLAIIGVLSVGGIAGYSKAMMKYRINKTIEQITLIAGNIRTFFAPQGNYDGVKCSCDSSGCTGSSDGDGCPIIKKAKILPDEMLTVDANGKITSIINAFGEKVDLGNVGKNSSGDGKGFYFYYVNVDEEPCIELATQDWTSANIGAICWTIGSKSCYKTPIDLTTALDLCNDGTDLYFNFDIDVSSNYWKGLLK